MADIAIFRINYKSDFILTLNSDAGWMTPFCIKFWTGAPSQAYFVGFDGTTYTHCAPVDGEPTKLLVQFDDHHLPIGDLKFQIGYHFTVADFPTSVEDEVLNQASVIIEVDDAPAQVMLDLNGETAPEIEFSLPAYANEAQRIANEEQRIAHEQQRIANEDARIQAEETRQYNEQQRIQHEEYRVSEFARLKSESEAATTAANAAATLANEKAQLAADKAALADAAATLANEKAQLAADKAALAQAAATLANEKAALAEQKAAYAQTQGDYAKAQGDYAKAQGDTAQADHVRAEADHTTAADDHTQAADDHETASSDHSRAEEDHTTAASDHTRAEVDHSTASADHTTATNDHTQAVTDHSTATSDHTQADNDHTRAESDHTRAESDHAAVEVYVDSLGVFDLSKYNAVGGVLATYADLSAALTAINALDSKYKYGGMSFKYVCTYDNKYVQYRLMADEFTTDITQWQGVDDKPTAGSKNLVESGGVKARMDSLSLEVGIKYKDLTWADKIWSSYGQTLKDTSSGITVHCEQFFAVKSGVTYKSFNLGTYHIFMWFYTDVNSNGVGVLWNLSGDRTFTPPSDGYIRIGIGNAEGIAPSDMTSNNGVIGNDSIIEELQDVEDDVTAIQQELTKIDEVDAKTYDIKNDVNIVDVSFFQLGEMTITDGQPFEYRSNNTRICTKEGVYINLKKGDVVGIKGQTGVISNAARFQYGWIDNEGNYRSNGVNVYDRVTIESDGKYVIYFRDSTDVTQTSPDYLFNKLFFDFSSRENYTGDIKSNNYEIKNAIGLVDVSFFRLGGMSISEGQPFTYNENYSRICTKEGVYIDLVPGDVVGIKGKEGQTTGSRFYYGWIDSSNNYHSGGQWIYDRVTIANKGRYVFYFRDVTDVVQASPDDLFNKLFFDFSARGEQDLPSYYLSYIRDKSDEVMEEITDGTENDTFVFITDTHTNQSSLKGGLVVRAISENTGVTKVISGGDICDSKSSGGWSDVRGAVSLFSKYIGSYCKTLYHVRGNHDFNGLVSGTVQGYDSKVVKSWMLNMCANNIVTNPNDIDGTYYYFDNNASRIRYIVFDTYKGSAICLNNKTDYVQFDWIATQAIATIPSGWNIIFLTHEPITKRFDVSAHSFTNIKAIVDAASNKTIAVLQNETEYDFTNLNARVIACLAGHSHTDIATWDNNVLHIRTQNNKLTNLISPFSEGTAFGVTEKPLGTIYEQAFDIVVVKPSDNLISCIRVGFGTNRYFHLTKTTIAVSGTTQLSVSKITPSSWKSSNCDDCVYDLTNNVWSYTDDIISVDSSGNVTGLKAGDAFVFAENTNGDKEYFHVVVE